MEYPDAERNLELLDEELRRLELPGYQGVARMVKRRGPDGVVVPSAPYLLVAVGQLADEQRARLDQAVASHDPAERTPAQLAMETASAELAQRRAAAARALTSLAQRAASGDELARDLVAILAGVGGWGLGGRGGVAPGPRGGGGGGPGGVVVPGGTVVPGGNCGAAGAAAAPGVCARTAGGWGSNRTSRGGGAEGCGGGSGSTGVAGRDCEGVGGADTGAGGGSGGCGVVGGDGWAEQEAVSSATAAAHQTGRTGSMRGLLRGSSQGSAYP